MIRGKAQREAILPLLLDHLAYWKHPIDPLTASHWVEQGFFAVDPYTRKNISAALKRLEK